MQAKKWTIQYTTDKKSKIKDFFYFKNVDKLCDLCFVDFKQEEFLTLLYIDIGDCWEGKYFTKQVVFGEAEIIANILSWNYNISVKIKKIYSSNPKKIKLPSKKAIDAKFFYKEMFLGKFTEENLKILSGYRQIKNEKNRALKYLMYYRLLEIFAKPYKGNIDKLFCSHEIKTQIIRDSRNHKNVKSLVSYIRNKIHATKNSYRFPYKELSKNLDKIEKIVRLIITKIIDS